MQNALFFDTDSILKQFINHKQTNLSFHPVLFEESLNTVHKRMIEPYLDSEILSVFVHSEPLDTHKLDLFPDLKLIATRSTGFNHIDLDYCKKRGIEISNVPRYGESTVAEFTFGLILALSRKIILGRNAMAHNHVEIEKYIGFDLEGKTIGVIGTGSIGRHVIQIARGFNMQVLAYDLYPDKALQDIYVDDLKEIYHRADIISLHIPSTPQNFHLLNEKAFHQMKKGVIIINTARGDLIDTQALYGAIRQGIVGGAGLDVLENEDFLLHDEAEIAHRTHDFDFLLDSAMNLKLLQFPNVIATPHIAFNTIDAINRINQITFENIESLLNNHIQNSVLS